ncbi:MAG: cytochrome c, partial [Gemmatimonadetes bacterium]|nr:cytochrome c [Gemmatimonadota bacterium]
MTANVIARRAAVLALPLLFGACSWFTDFKYEPSVKPWQQFSADSGELKAFRGQPSGSVSTLGTAAAAWQVSYAPVPGTIDSLSKIENPVPADERSLANGRKYFSINCAVCHGDLGDGNGMVKQVTGIGFVLPLTSDKAKSYTDGYIWGMMRNGRGLMPSMNRIEERERWDVVNYVRGLQGKYPVPTGPVGRPGETGDKLPGATLLGPQVPSQYYHPVVSVRPVKHEGAAAAEIKPAADAA